MADTQQAQPEKAEKAVSYVTLVNVLDAKGKIVPPGEKLKLTKAEAEALPPGSVDVAKAEKTEKTEA